MKFSTLSSIIFLVILSFFCIPHINSQEQENSDLPSILKKPFSFRIGGGYAISFVDFDFEDYGTYYGVTTPVVDDDVDSGFTFPNFAVNLELKSKFFIEYISVGSAIDYNVIPIEDLELTIQPVTEVKGEEDDVTDVHVLSFLGFLEFRYPFKMGENWIAPYLRGGLGVNLNLHDNSDLIDINTSSFAAFVSIGVEYFVNDQISVFFEPRWHYNKPDMELMPYEGDTKFEGDVYLSNLTILIGINLYFGGDDEKKATL